MALFQLTSVHILSLSLLAILTMCVKSYARKPRFPGVPAVGLGGQILSWITVIELFARAPEMIRQSYEKHKGSPLKLPELTRWHLLLTSPAAVDELRKAPEHVMSFNEAVLQSFAMSYVFGDAILRNPYHLSIIRVQFTRNLGSIFSEIHTEVMESFDDLVPATHEWVTLPGFDTVIRAICRTTNRVFVGAPLWKNPDYLDLNIRWTKDVIQAGIILKPLPGFMRPLAKRLLTNLPEDISRAMKHLGPVIQERFSKMAMHGEDWHDKPRDLLQWYIDAGEENDVHRLCLRMLASNFAATHIASMTLTSALFRLAAHPQYAELLHDEVSRVVSEAGWTKLSVQRMHKVDSFIKECGTKVGMSRLALQDYTFQDGTFAPKGSLISVASEAIQSDPDIYANPETFDPWRFDTMREDHYGSSRLVTTSVNFLAFGHGHHACPGRYLSATMLKCMLAHIVTTYDVKLENDGDIPKRERFYIFDSPSRTAKVLFRKREV